VIVRDNGLCQVRGPRCQVVATTAHHRRPSSQHPELFWNVENLEAACSACNAHGAVVKAENRANPQTFAHLEQVIADQQAEINELVARLARYEDGLAEAETEAKVPRIS
jgi:hypothetical protein